MPLVGVSTNLSASTSTTVTLGGTSTSTPSAPSAPSAPSTPSTPSVPTAGAARSFGMSTGETVYLNLRLGGPPTAWVPYTVAYVFADGNAVLIREPDCVAYTGDMGIGTNLRRKGGEYGDTTPGP